jgi:signal transduction histidine kinase
MSDELSLRAPRGRLDGQSVLLHGLQVLAFCCVVAVFTTMIWPDRGYVHQLVYSVCIGMLVWASIEFGRLLVPARYCHRAPGSAGHGWPRGWRGFALTAAGIAIGFVGGTRIAPWLLGDAIRTPQRDLTLALLVTIAAGVVASYYFHARGKEAALQAEIAAAERDASEARLMLLQSQLEPHMLFNTLANLRALIGVDPAAAQRMLDRLDDFLRSTLEASRATSHPLAAEFARLEDYLELIAIRMGPRLSFELRLPDALRQHPVPPLIVQPLVENAIRHGLEPHRDGGRIEVSAERAGDDLVLAVRDTGVGFDPDARRVPGRFGLSQVRERLASAFGDRGRVDIDSRPGAGTTVRVVLPASSTVRR